jgi:hypothetical protein
LGFVDKLGDFDEAVKVAQQLGRVKGGKPNLIQYRLRHDLSDLFRLFGKTETPVIKVDMGIEAPKLQAGQLYFLSPMYLQ